MNLEQLTRAVVKVGAGRGFLVEAERLGRLVLTAAHCLPEIPPAHPWSHTEERTCPLILGNLDQPARIWAEVLFVDPIADLAVLGEPDNQALFEEAEAYGEFVAGRPILPVGSPQPDHPVRVLTLGAVWTSCAVGRLGGSRQLSLADYENCPPGTSGSPILNSDGAAVAIISTGSLNPILSQCLPLWVMEQLR